MRLLKSTIKIFIISKKLRKEEREMSVQPVPLTPVSGAAPQPDSVNSGTSRFSRILNRECLIESAKAARIALFVLSVTAATAFGIATIAYHTGALGGVLSNAGWLTKAVTAVGLNGGIAITAIGGSLGAATLIDRIRSYFSGRSQAAPREGISEEELRALENALIERENRAQALEGRRAEVEARLNAPQLSENTLANREHQLQQLEARRDALAARERSPELNEDALDARENEVQQLEATRDRLNVEIARLREERNVAQDRRQDAQEKFEEAVRRGQDLEYRFNRLQGELSKKDEEIQNIGNELEKTTERTEGIQNELRKARERESDAKA
ncbi:MAG: hypothetical protein WAM28_06780, partial [Chlamydiales bacterium]